MNNQMISPCPDDATIRYAQEAVRRYAVLKTTDDNFGRAAASAEYRVANSEVARCYLRLLAAYNPDERLREALVKARAVLTNSQAESGYCMCGDPVASHSIGSGHSPVDSHIYMAGQVIKDIDSALSPLPQGDDT